MTPFAVADLMGEHGHAFNGNERPCSAQSRASLREAFERMFRLIRL